MPNSETITMKLAEMGSLVGAGKDALWMREVRNRRKAATRPASSAPRACGLDHTTRAADMFTRWCQEDFFGYMMEHFAIEMLSEYTSKIFLTLHRS